MIEDVRMLRLGIIGMSPGNGHPYSWAAICNGYNKEYMKDCPFSVIPQYLGEQKFPQDAIQNAKVTHIWTQDDILSHHIAKASKIDHIVQSVDEMLGHVDAVLLARDDYENHYSMSKVFLEAGVPIFIDKPLAVTIEEAEKIYALEQFSGQIFTCSALKFAREFTLTENDLIEVGDIYHIDAWIMKDWEKYSIHVIEPSLNFLPENLYIKDVKVHFRDNKKNVKIAWNNGFTASFSTLGATVCTPTINIFGTKGSKQMYFKDTFFAFKASLQAFINSIRTKKLDSDREKVFNVIKVIAAGLDSRE